jgi:hypothetical protein
MDGEQVRGIVGVQQRHEMQAGRHPYLQLGVGVLERLLRLRAHAGREQFSLGR